MPCVGLLGYSQQCCWCVQAEDRAHRIGQKKEVLVLVLVSAGTIEQVILDRAQQKKEIDAKVIQVLISVLAGDPSMQPTFEYSSTMSLLYKPCCCCAEQQATCTHTARLAFHRDQKHNECEGLLQAR